MAAHFAIAEQEKALASLVGSGDGPAALRIANWPKKQQTRITEMRALWVIRLGQASMSVRSLVRRAKHTSILSSARACERARAHTH